MTEGAATGAECERDVLAFRDAVDVAEDVFVRIKPEALLQDEAVVHGLGCARTDAVVLRNVRDQLEVGAIVEGATGENVLGGEGEDLVAIPFELAQAGPVILPVFGKLLAAFHARDRRDEFGDPRDKCLERREPVFGCAFGLLARDHRVGHARSICSGQAGVGNALPKCRTILR
jgi:hypothetical protein